LHVIVVGGGIGGMTSALALARRGIAATVVEQAQAFGETGAGVQLSPNATRTLFALGLEAEVRAIGFAPEAAEVRDHASGRLLLRNVLGEAAVRRWAAPYLTAHRADLHAVLTSAARAAGVEMRLGAPVAALEVDGVRLADGERLAADAVIGGDGVRSTVRLALFGPDAPRFTGHVAWRFAVPIEGPASATVRVWTGPDRHFVAYPVRGGALMNVVAVTEEADWRRESWSEPGDKAALLAAFQGWPAETLALIGAAESVFRWALYDRAPMARWSVGAATLLGDAAHPTPPFLAQGAAMAIEDAMVLARCLSTGDPVEASLRRYELARRARTAKAQGWSRRNGVLFHLPGAAAAAVFGAASALDAITPGGGAARFDWLYGYDAATAPLPQPTVA
jgi:salicylate hydroxylase